MNCGLLPDIMWFPSAMGMSSLWYRNDNASLLDSNHPVPSSRGKSRAQHKAYQTALSCKQGFAKWQAEPANCMRGAYFCDVHIRFDMPRLRAILLEAAWRSGCARRNATRRGKEVPAGWPRRESRWCPPMFPGLDRSPWNQSSTDCHSLDASRLASERPGNELAAFELVRPEEGDVG